MNKALVIFCEGPNDTAFLKMIFELSLKTKHLENKILKDYPKPFSNIFTTSVTTYFKGDLTREMAHKFFLPDFVFEYNDWFVLLFNTGGETETLKIKKMISLIEEQMKLMSDKSFDIKQIKYLFTYDADDKTPKEKVNWIVHEIGSIDENEVLDDPKAIEEAPQILWSIPSFSSMSENDCSAVDKNAAVYIWSGDNLRGTLEDILLPVFLSDNRDLITSSEQFVDQNFTTEWATSSDTDSKTISAKKANRQKALFTCAGQGKKPGKPLTAILSDFVLAKEQTILSNKKITDISSFFKNLMETEI